jgi:ribosomal protein S18 acetylase RimI-like enzyme
MTGPDIRAAGPADADAVADLHADSWRRSYRGMMPDAYLDGDVVADRRRVWHDRFAEPRPDQRVWLVDGGSGPAGFVCLFGDGDPELGGYVDNLHVRRDAQGTGLGAALLRRSAAWMRAERPGSGLYLWVLEANRAARGFYRRLGAVEDARETFGDPGGGSAPALRCVWPDPAVLTG